MNKKALFAELLGTFLFVFVGVLSVISALYPEGNAANLVGIGLAHGITIALLATMFGSISGGHFNPAVSMGMFVAGKMKLPDLLGYWIVQVIGATAAGFLAVFCVGPAAPVDANFGVPSVQTYIDPLPAMLFEMIGAMVLVLTVFFTAVSDKAPKLGGLYIGLSISAMIMAVGPFTGASINPARFLGPAIANQKFENASTMASSPAMGMPMMMAIYVVAPLIAGVLAALIYKAFSKNSA